MAEQRSGARGSEHLPTRLVEVVGRFSDVLPDVAGPVVQAEMLGHSPSFLFGMT